MTTATNAIDVVNSLLRGELAATETYQQALDKVSAEPEAMRLREIHREHREAANELRICIRNHGAVPDHGSGAWGSFAKAVEGTAKVFGNAAALKALKEGEELGVNNYRQALDEQELPADCRTLITSRLLPQTQRHVATLDSLIEAI